MPPRFFTLTGCITVAIAAILAPVLVAGQSSALRTPWGEPDLQGLWTDPYQTPLQRATKYGDREFLTPAEIAETDKQRLAMPDRPRFQGRDSSSIADVAGAYNGVFVSVRPTGRRTSLVVDPPNGRILPVTPEVEKRRAVMREYTLALLQNTPTCKNHEGIACAGWNYGPPSPRRNERPPYYSTGILNRADGPEDRNLSARCLSSVLPAFDGFRRIVQSPNTVSIFYDVGQGQGWQRVIPITTLPHIPATVREPWGDSRGRWEGDTLVVDVTNFGPLLDFQGSKENLHLAERWIRRDAKTIDYAVTIEDPTTWTKPWSVKQELILQDNQLNRIYYEPRCHEGNFSMVGILSGARAAEKAFAEGKGPDPASIDIYSVGQTFFLEVEPDYADRAGGF